VPISTSVSPAGSSSSRAVELDELLGYHLEQAARYLDELGRDGGLALAES
jgi:hypothetical protein